MPQKNPTLQTIADIAGVSKNTVSCALRADPRISKATQERIRQIAKEVGYRPNPMVSALMQSLRQSHPVAKSANLAFVHCTDDPEAWRNRRYYAELHTGAEARASEMGYNLTPVWGMEPGMTEDRFAKILRSRNVLGLLIGPLGPLGDGDNRLPIDWENWPSAAMGASLREPQLHRAATYFTHTIPRAWHELRALGYNNVGVAFTQGANLRVDYALEAGCAILASELGEPLPVLRHADLTDLELHAWIEQFQLEAIITSSSQLPDLLKSSGLRVPEDIALVSLMNDSPLGARIERDWRAIGAAAVDLVVGQLLRNERGVPAKPKTVLIEGEWNPGDLQARG